MTPRLLIFTLALHFYVKKSSVRWIDCEDWG